jgi:putative nucleotidyltransferase with HDIG domain
MLDQARERKLKEILYSLLETVRATRAAVYLTELGGVFRLVTYYGYTRRELPPTSLASDHPLPRWVAAARRPCYANQSSEAGILAPVMRDQGFSRVLAAPIYVGGRMVGLVEAREKAAGAPFVPTDLTMMSAVVDQLGSAIRELDLAPLAPVSADLLDSSGFFELTDGARLRAGALTPVPPRAAAASPATAVFRSVPATSFRPTPPPRAFEPTPLPAPTPEFRLPELPELPSREPARQRPPLTRHEVALFQGFTGTLLLIPEVETVAFSLWTSASAEFYVGTRRALADDARDAVVANVDKVFARVTPPFRRPEETRFNVEYPMGRGDGEIARSALAAIQTSTLDTDETRALFLTLVFGTPVPESSRDTIRATHRLLRSVVIEAKEYGRYRDSYRGWVHKFLEPGIKRFTDLKQHSLAVGRLARQFASFLSLPSSQVEQLTVAGILHDVGLRELDYDRLSEKRALTEGEMKLARNHPVVGALLLEDLEFPYPIAPIVRHHHERFDGSGYPDHLRGGQIPFGARMIHILEAFDAMTSSASYRPPISKEAALEILVSKGETQFDPDLVVKFREMMRTADRAEGR